MKTLKTESGNFLTFLRNYYIIEGNNGNHAGYNRIWTVWDNAFNTKKEANKAHKEGVKENGDVEYGLTPLLIRTPEEIIEIINSSERINYHGSHDIYENE